MSGETDCIDQAHDVLPSPVERGSISARSIEKWRELRVPAAAVGDTVDLCKEITSLDALKI